MREDEIRLEDIEVKAVELGGWRITLRRPSDPQWAWYMPEDVMKKELTVADRSFEEVGRLFVIERLAESGVIEENEPYELSELVEDVGFYARQYPEFRKPTNRSFLDAVAGIHTELSEATQLYVNGWSVGEERVRVRQPDNSTLPQALGIRFELADVIIRTADLAEEYNIDLSDAVRRKMMFLGVKLDGRD